MKVLKDIVYGVSLLETKGSTEVEVSQVCFDSRKVKPGALFVAVKGTQVDGHDYINQALENGAHAIIGETRPEDLPGGISFLKTDNSARALGIVAARYYENPSEDLQLVAITGTNGKTTTTTLLYNLFQQLGFSCGLISTVEIRVGKRILPATHTTPDPLQLQQNLRAMADEGVEYVFMEASSHGIQQERMAGMVIRGAVFTNLSHDHLDYHGTFQNYLRAKKKLFDELPRNAFALVNVDDKHGNNMLQNCAALKYSYALKNDADFKGRVLETQRQGMLLRLADKEVWTRLLGRFNAYNITALYATARLLGVESLEIARALSQLPPVEGRFQHVQGESGLTVFVDYAHTPDALENVLKTLQELRAMGGGKVWTVVGCGGNRDKAKRPLMAQIALKHSDQVVFTSDNPRNEEPASIIADMEAGVPGRQNRYLSIADRRQAIKTAMQMAQPEDLILIAGKGHEKYQEVQGKRHSFDDLALVRENFQTPPA